MASASEMPFARAMACQVRPAPHVSAMAERVVPTSTVWGLVQEPTEQVVGVGWRLGSCVQPGRSSRWPVHKVAGSAMLLACAMASHVRPPPHLVAMACRVSPSSTGVGLVHKPTEQVLAWPDDVLSMCCSTKGGHSCSTNEFDLQCSNSLGSGSGFTFSAEPVSGYGQRHCQPLLQRPHHARPHRATTSPAFN